MKIKGDESLLLGQRLSAVEDYSKNKDLEKIIVSLASILGDANDKCLSDLTSCDFPTLHVLGNPRSGTTYLMQLLNASKKIYTPTNVLARFSYASYVGALIEKMLFHKEFDPRNELEFSEVVQFKSNMGVTSGYLNVNEFYHFWRRYLPNYDVQYLDDEELDEIDFDGLNSGLNAIKNVFEKPLALKSMMIQFNLSDISPYLENARYLYIYRNPLDVMNSILKVRRDYYDSDELWWSVKPKAYSFLKDLDIYHQIAGQVYFSNLEIQQGLKELSKEQYKVIRYEDLVSQPEYIVENILSWSDDELCLLSDVFACELKNEPEGEDRFFVEAYNRFYFESISG